MTSPVLLWAVEPGAVSEGQRARVQELARGYELIVGLDGAAVDSVSDRVEVLSGWLPPAQAAALPRLRWYQQWIAGADWLLECPAAVEHPFVLTNASGVSAGVVADQVLAYVLVATRRMRDAWQQQRETVWRKPALDEFGELDGKTMLIAGVGALGSRVARRARGFGLRLIGVRRSADRPAEGFDETIGSGALAGRLPQADVVVSALPYTRETHGLFGAEAFACMRAGALFVSVGRGEVVDEAALISALAGGRLAGAGLDVFLEEPLPATSPLWRMPQVTMTPHWGAMFPDRFARTFELFCDNLARHSAGQPLRNVVDKRRGY